MTFYDLKKKLNERIKDAKDKLDIPSLQTMPESYHEGYYDALKECRRLLRRVEE